MNTNKIKKISVKFPNIVNRLDIDYEGKRLVQKIPALNYAQFTFASGEEKKVCKIIDKNMGIIIPSRKDLNQWGIEETNLSGTTYQVENVHEQL